MATTRELLSTVKNVSAGGITPQDFPFKDPQIIAWIDYHADFLRKRDIDDKGFVDASNIQDLGCYPLTKIDEADCTLVNWGTDIKYVDMPNNLQLKRSNSVTFFGFVNKITSIPFKDTNIMGLNDYIRFPSKNQLSASQIGTRIYVRGANALNLCYVNIQGVFESPTQVKVCPTEGSIPTCRDWDCQYPLGSHLIAEMCQRIWSIEMKLGLDMAQIEQKQGEIKPI